MISAVIVAHNRPDLCRKSVLSIMNQVGEVIVIDNSKPEMRYHGEEGVAVVYNENDLGLSFGRNLGASLAKGDLIVFLDDDAEASAGCISEMRKLLEGGYGIVGASIIPKYEINPPSWYSEREYGWIVGVGVHIGGACFAVKREVFEKVGYFNERLGRKNGNLMSDEESEFFGRSCHAGITKARADSAICTHFVPKERLTRRYAVRRIWYEGRSWAVMERCTVARCARYWLGFAGRGVLRLITNKDWLHDFVQSFLYFSELVSTMSSSRSGSSS